jgi:hypothetical protein
VRSQPLPLEGDVHGVSIKLTTGPRLEDVQKWYISKVPEFVAVFREGFTSSEEALDAAEISEIEAGSTTRAAGRN